MLLGGIEDYQCKTKQQALHRPGGGSTATEIYYEGADWEGAASQELKRAGS
jgi:hypothetical protein